MKPVNPEKLGKLNENQHIINFKFLGKKHSKKKGKKAK